MKKAVWSAAAAAAILMFATSAYAQTTVATATLTATATVGNQARLTLTGVVDFPDTDPDTLALITAAPVTVQARARVAPTTLVSLTVQAGATHFDPATSTIPVGNLSWTVSGAPFVAGTANNAVAQALGSWSGPANHTGSQTYRLQNLWSYAPGSYSLVLNYTLSTP
jgi:hypothetical protein